MEYKNFGDTSDASAFDCQRTQLHDYRMEEAKRVAKKGRRGGFVVTDGDVDMLRCVHDHRLLRIEQVAALTGRTYSRVHRRLKGLFDAGLLCRIEQPQRKDIYHLGKAGLELLLSHGLIMMRKRSAAAGNTNSSLEHWITKCSLLMFTSPSRSRAERPRSNSLRGKKGRVSEIPLRLGD